MLTDGVRAQIKKTLPGIIERSRMGDQNALAMLTGLHRQRNKDERTRFAYECALSIVKRNPKASDGIVRIGSEDSGIANIPELCQKYSPLTVAIALLPVRNVLDSSKVPTDVWYYLESYTQLLNGDFRRFPQIQYELGV